ncbi:hypothetical protein E2P81_ATG05270 [Venturia nashicola]|nr:hypothetical protein E2P81_ATG05270 [Venturia nashicola]
MRVPASPVSSSQINPDAKTPKIQRELGQSQRRSDTSTPYTTVASEPAPPISSSHISPNITTPQNNRKRGRPKKEYIPRPSAPVPSSSASPTPSLQDNPDTTPTSIKRKRGRPKKDNISLPPTKITNSAAVITSRRNSRATLAPISKVPTTPPQLRCRLDALYKEQRRNSGAGEISPRRAHVVHLPTRRSSAEPADRAQKRAKQSSSPNTSTPSLLFEGQRGSQTNYFEYDGETANRFEGGLQSNRLPTPLRCGEALADPTRSIALSREVTDGNRGKVSQFKPADSVGSGHRTGSFRHPDRYNSGEALIFCGLAEDVSAAYYEEWKKRREPGTLGSFALNKIKEMAMDRGFNPWACSDLALGNLWDRMRNLAIAREYHDILFENLLPDGKRKWRWERNWTSSLRELGFAKSLIDTVGRSLYVNMRLKTPVSHWAYNFVDQKWNELTGHDNKIKDTLSGRNFGAEKRSSEEEERHREEREYEQSDLQVETEGRRLAEMVSPRSLSLFSEFDLFPDPFDDGRSDDLFRDVTTDGEDSSMDWPGHIFEDDDTRATCTRQ